MQEPKVLLITDSLALPGSIVLSLLQEFQDSSLAIVTQASHLGKSWSSLDAVISLGESAELHTLEWLTGIANALRPGGLLIVQEPILLPASPSHGRHSELQVTAAAQTEAELERKLLLAGFVDFIKIETLKDLFFFGSFSTRSSNLSISTFSLPQSISIKAQKAVLETGAVFEIKKAVLMGDGIVSNNVPKIVSSSDESTPEKTVSAAKENGATSLVMKILSMDTDDLVDEDALLTEEDVNMPQLQPGGDDSQVGNNSGRKACKHCTCGRAELEEKGKLTPEQLNNPQSACGNCGLGDAFRCNNCPYRGLPAFELGEKIVSTGSFLVVDA